MTVRLGLIGVGRWGANYVTTLAAVRGATLARVASHSGTCRSQLPDHCALHTDWRTLIQAGDLDGVIISAPTRLHAEMTEACIERNLGVLVEKPLTTDLPSAERLLQLAEAHSSLVLVNHTHLFHPAYQKLKELVTACGSLRAIKSIGGNWGPFRTDTPPLWDWGPHDVALSLDLIGQPPEHISTTTIERRTTQDGLGEIIKLDFRFHGGVVAQITIGNIMSTKRRYFAAHCDDDVFVYDDMLSTKLRRISPDSTTDTTRQRDRDIDIVNVKPLTRLVQNFVDGIASGTRDLSHLRLAVEVVRVLTRCDMARLQEAP